MSRQTRPGVMLRLSGSMLTRFTVVLSALTAALTSIVALGETSPFVVSIAVGVALSSVFFMVLLARFGPPSSHSVALIGFQRSGKTTLLVTMLNELLFFRVSGDLSTRLRGERTIKRVTSYMKRLQLRQAVGSTTRRSQFPYEVNVSRKGLFGRSLKLSFGDFPGERSKEYVAGSGDNEEDEDYEGMEKRSVRGHASYYAVDGGALFDPEFFRWILECDALVFVVDVAHYLMGRARGAQFEAAGTESDYVVEMSQAYIRTWSYIVDARNEGGETTQPIVVLAFTKSDLFDVDSRVSANESAETMMATAGFEEPLPAVREISRLNFEAGRQRCEEDFGELIRFLKGHSEEFRLVFTSSLALMDGRRLGVKSLFHAVVPRSFE